MSGLVAVLATPGSARIDENELRELDEAYQRRRPPVEAPRSEGNERVRVVVYEPGRSTAQSAQLGSWIAATGSIYPSAPWPEHHARHVENVDGQFVLVSYDASRDEVVVANDPMGMSALFVGEVAGRLYVSTSALVLAGHLGSSASRLGVQEFLLSGYHFGTRTHWDGVRRLDPATCIVVGTDRIQERTYWRPRIDPLVRSLSLEQASAHHIEVGRSTYEERLAHGKSWADLTGGFDSRLLCLLLESAGVEFATNTRSAPTPDDVVIARRVASTKGWEWLDARLPPEWPLVLPDLLDTALTWGDGQLEVLQLARVLYAHQRLADLRPQRLLSAGGGEHFQYYAWQPEFLNAGRSNSFDMGRWIDMIALKPTDATVLAGTPRPEVLSDLADRLSRWIEPYADESNTLQLDLAYAYKSTGHFGAYRSADEGSLRAELPFYFKPIISAALSTDHRHRNGHRLMRHMIGSLDAGAAALPTTRGGPALPWHPSRAHRYLPYFGVVGRKGINKLTQRTLGRPLLARQPVFAWQQAADGAVLAALTKQGLLDPPRMRLVALLDEGRFRSLLSAALRPGFRHSAMLGRIITVEMALRATDTTLD